MKKIILVLMFLFNGLLCAEDDASGQEGLKSTLYALTGSLAGGLMAYQLSDFWFNYKWPLFCAGIGCGIGAFSGYIASKIHIKKTVTSSAESSLDTVQPFDRERERDRVLVMKDHLQEVVIDQSEAIECLTRALQIHYAGLADPNRPIGVFLFLGPTGVGKTELAKALARYLFDSEDKLVRFDMSEYVNKEDITKLIGASPGYLGYGEGGKLTEAVKHNPHCVILFDEIEKAHSGIYDLFLQIFDEGRLTDGCGVTVSLKNCVIIMTSNMGSHLSTPDRFVLEQLLKAKFRPELLNRIDAHIYFNRLNESSLIRIAKLQLAGFQKLVSAHGISIGFDESVISHLVSRGYDSEYGARPLKRLIQRDIVFPIAQSILKNPDKKTFLVGMEGAEIVIG